jgi:hypothetical protein
MEIQALSTSTRAARITGTSFLISDVKNSLVYNLYYILLNFLLKGKTEFSVIREQKLLFMVAVY